MKLIDLFAGINLDDDQITSNIMNEFSFESKEHQSQCLRQLREDLGFKYKNIHAMLQLSNAAWDRLSRGESTIQPPQLRLLLTMLLLREINQELFNRLCLFDESETKVVDNRRKARFNIRK